MRIYECLVLHSRACTQRIRLFLYRRHPLQQRLFPLGDPSTQLFAHGCIERTGRCNICVDVAFRLSQRLAILSNLILYNRPGAKELPDRVDGACGGRARNRGSSLAWSLGTVSSIREPSTRMDTMELWSEEGNFSIKPGTMEKSMEDPLARPIVPGGKWSKNMTKLCGEMCSAF